MEKNGGPAFPRPRVPVTKSDMPRQSHDVGAGGMTLLDYFAAKAPRAPGSFVRRYCGYDGNANLHTIKEDDQLRADAAWSYKWAAARLAEKARREADDE